MHLLSVITGTLLKCTLLLKVFFLIVLFCLITDLTLKSLVAVNATCISFYISGTYVVFMFCNLSLEWKQNFQFFLIGHA